MDALALLCTLHADGPATLKRLRQSGHASLESIAELELARLVEILGTTPASAQRFQREARHLLERVGHRAPDSERALEPELEVDAPLQMRTPAEPKAALPRRRQFDDVLDRWRLLDAADDARAAAETIVEESSAPNPRTVLGTPLGAFREIEESARRALESTDIYNLEALAACDPLRIARDSGLAYTNVVRLRALARRANKESKVTPVERFSRALEPKSEPEPIATFDAGDFVLRPAPRPLGEPHEETAGGPFV